MATIPSFPDCVWTVLDGPQNIAIRMPSREPCKTCGGAFVFTVQTSRGGGSFGSSHEHADDCKTLFCEHGVRWQDGCDKLHEGDTLEDEEAPPCDCNGPTNGIHEDSCATVVY